MRLRSTHWILAVLISTLFLFIAPAVWSHCEIPCGIYGDKSRIDILYEHVTTVEKSMKQIEALQAESKINYNQLVRWVNNKEEHANEIQEIVTQYFMTQRVKPKGDGDAARTTYVKQLTALHGMLVLAMKAKQTTDTAHCTALRKHIDSFSASYFSAEDLKHVREHHGAHSETK